MGYSNEFDFNDALLIPDSEYQNEITPAYQEALYEVDANGEIILDDNGIATPTGEVINHPAVMQTWVNIHPEYDYTIEDVTEEYEIKQAEKAARKAERKVVRQFRSDINASDLPNWHKRLLKVLIKELRD